MTPAHPAPVALGYRFGWHDAARYATGTRADRRAIRRRLAQAELSGAAFWQGYVQAFYPRAEAFGQAIEEGRLARTCRPTRLYAVCNRSQVGCPG